MEKLVKQTDIVLLFDRYHTESRNLHTSFQLEGKKYPAIVIEDNGFLPDDVISVYGYFMGDFRKEEGVLGRPRYFNEIRIPDYWELSGNGVSGKVQDLTRERARIYYAEPFHKRLVRVVDWLDEKGTVRYSDHYNKYGALCGRTVFNKKGQRVNRSYFSADNKEVIVENFVTGDIILNEGKAVRIFKTKTAFVKYFFEKTGFSKAAIYFNSLSVPFFVSCALPANGKKDVLFWQEPVGKEIPGNMQMILRREAVRTGQIFVQKRVSYDKLIELGANTDIIGRRGYVYPFERKNQYRAEALICTNSDQIEKCREIAEALPQMHFHIAALTEMSSKLLSMGNYENVTVYPAVKMECLENLFKKCDWYLDINHGNEIVSAVWKAFLNNQLILGFQETLHQSDFVAKEHIYPAERAGDMIGQIRRIMGNREEMDQHLHMQHEMAMAENEGSAAL